jgi:hypothetical protein
VVLWVRWNRGPLKVLGPEPLQGWLGKLPLPVSKNKGQTLFPRGFLDQPGFVLRLKASLTPHSSVRLS